MLVLAVPLIAAPHFVLAQDPPQKRTHELPKSQVVLPDAEKIVTLIRSALLTLNDAVQTGNFTVLRDKAAPSFQTANTAARLAIIFQSLGQQRIDLTAVAVLAPQLTQTPAIDANQRLRLTGSFPGNPIRIDFDLVFQAVDGRWRLFGISVNPTQAAADSAASSGFTTTTKTLAPVAKDAFTGKPTEAAKPPKN